MNKADINKQPRFDPKTLKPFDRVLVRDTNEGSWKCTIFSHSREREGGFIDLYKYVTTDNSYICCIPYNDDTEHLVGTADEAPEYYRYWED